MSNRSHDGKGFLGRGYYSIHCGICLQSDMIEEVTITYSEAVTEFRDGDWHKVKVYNWICGDCFRSGKHKPSKT
jgi:hypothetical protein